MKNDVLFNIKELHNLIGKVMFCNTKVMPKYKPSATQVRFIDYLCKNQDKMITGHDLQTEFKLSKATVSDVLNTMEKHKIITRVVSDVDTRSKYIILNDEYKEIHQMINKEMKNIKKVITKDISDDELIEFNEIANKMKNNVDEYIKERCDKCD